MGLQARRIVKGLDWFAANSPNLLETNFALAPRAMQKLPRHERVRGRKERPGP